MAHPSIPSPPPSSLSSSLLKNSSSKDKDISISGDIQPMSITDSKEELFGEKIAAGTLTVSDAMLLLRCTALKRKMREDKERSGSVSPAVAVELKQSDRIPTLNFNSLSNSLAAGSSLPEGDKEKDKDKDKDGHALSPDVKVAAKESDAVSDIAAQKDIALMLEVMREKCPPSHPDINDSGTPSLDCVLSVLSTDSLLRGVRAMAAPHSSACGDIKTNGEKEVSRMANPLIEIAHPYWR